MTYQISGLDQKHLWIVRASNKATAEHLAALFRKEGYEKVTITELQDA